MIIFLNFGYCPILTKLKIYRKRVIKKSQFSKRIGPLLLCLLVSLLKTKSGFALTENYTVPLGLPKQLANAIPEETALEAFDKFLGFQITTGVIAIMVSFINALAVPSNGIFMILSVCVQSGIGSNFNPMLANLPTKTVYYALKFITTGLKAYYGNEGCSNLYIQIPEIGGRYCWGYIDQANRSVVKENYMKELPELVRYILVETLSLLLSDESAYSRPPLRYRMPSSDEFYSPFIWTF